MIDIPAPYTAVSLFSGMGGLDLAAKYAGFEVTHQVEKNDYCRAFLSKRWPNAAQLIDARNAGRHNLPYGPDCLFGGFPCQPFSKSGLRKGDADDRNMWPEFIRIIREIRPRFILMENVDEITRTATVDGVRRPAYALTVLGDLASAGYDASWRIISAADAGAGHLRNRWWCVAYPHGLGYLRPDQVQSGGDPDRDHSAPEQGRVNQQSASSAGGLLRDATAGRQGAEVADPRSVDADGSGSDVQGRETHGRGDAPEEWRTTPEEIERAGVLLRDTQNQRLERHRPLRKRKSGPRRAKGKSAWSGDHRTRRRPVPQSGVGADADGLPSWLVEHRRPAPPFATPYTWEPKRLLTKEEKPTDYADQLTAIGNAVFVPTAFAVFWHIREALDAQAR